MTATQSPTIEALKPCPFCGGEGWNVRYIKCGCGAQPELAEAQAIAAWNSRPSPTTEALIERLREEADAFGGSPVAEDDGNVLAKLFSEAAAALEALSRPSPIAEPQDSDAAWLRSYANSSANGWENRERLCRIAARLEAPIAEDALVERVIEAAQDVVTLARNEGVAAGNGNLVWGAAVNDLAAALQAIHEKKG